MCNVATGWSKLQLTTSLHSSSTPSYRYNSRSTFVILSQSGAGNLFIECPKCRAPVHMGLGRSHVILPATISSKETATMNQ